MNTNVKKIVVAGLLVAIAFIIPLLLPNLSPVVEFSATPLAHVPILLSMFIDPLVAVFVVIGTALSFFIKYPLIVGLRASSHIIFALVGAFMLKNSKSKSRVALTYVITLILHTAAEAIIVYFWFRINGTTLKAPLYLGLAVFAVHHTFDYIVTVIIYYSLNRSRSLKF